MIRACAKDEVEQTLLSMLRCTLFFFLLLFTGISWVNGQKDTTLIISGGVAVHAIYHQANTDKPLVVLQAGARSHSGTWAQLTSLLQQSGYSFFAYDRPGLGASQNSEKPRNARIIAMEQRELLMQMNFDKELVLVGHSMGGVYQAVFYQHYPESVVGLIMIDSPDRGWEADLRACLTESQNESRDSSLQVMRAGLSEAVQAEYRGGETSFEQLAQVKLFNMLVVISGGAQTWPAAYNGNCLTDAWIGVQKRIRALDVSSHHLISEVSGHGIPNQDPQIILKALSWVNK